VLPIIFVCAALALGGIALGFFALRARHAARVDTTASATASEIAAPPASTAPAATTEPVPTAVATAAPVVEVAEVDAAPATTANATPEVASASPSSASAAPSAKPASSAPAAPPFGQAPPVPPPVTAPPSAKPPVDPNAFSESTARARLALANGVLAFCKKEGGQTGPGSASVTFGPDGSVMGVAIDAPYAGTKEGDCAAGQFRRAKVNAFQGPPQTVRHTFDVPK
jgi:hypothetical protein